MLASAANQEECWRKRRSSCRSKDDIELHRSRMLRRTEAKRERGGCDRRMQLIRYRLYTSLSLLYDACYVAVRVGTTRTDANG